MFSKIQHGSLTLALKLVLFSFYTWVKKVNLPSWRVLKQLFHQQLEGNTAGQLVIADLRKKKVSRRRENQKQPYKTTLKIFKKQNESRR